MLGDTVAIMTVLESPKKLSFSTCVSLEPRNGVWSASWYSDRMHSFSARRLLLISAPSSLRSSPHPVTTAATCVWRGARETHRVFRSLCVVSAPRSEPARSMKDSLPVDKHTQGTPSPLDPEIRERRVQHTFQRVRLPIFEANLKDCVGTRGVRVGTGGAGGPARAGGDKRTLTHPQLHRVGPDKGRTERSCRS